MSPQPHVRRAPAISSGGRQAPRARESANATPRAQIGEVQRVRMLAAATQIVYEAGYGGMSVARVTGRAGVSRHTFYELFADREDCFLAVFDDGVSRASLLASAARDTAGDGWRERVRAGLGALLGFFDEEPQLGRLLVVSALGAGPRVLERRARVLVALARIVDEGRVSRGGEPRASAGRTPALTAEGTVGAVLSVVHARMLRAGRSPGQRLVGLLNELTGMVVLPYLGRAAGEEELGRRAPRAARAPRKPAVGPLQALPMRLTYRTLLVLAAVATDPGTSNRRIGELAGVRDQGQISKLLARLEDLELVHNTGRGQPRGEPNAWALTARGREIQQTIQGHTI
jgi:AcrR family transcriptional regulator